MAVGALLALGLLALAVRELSGADAAFDAWTQKLLGVFQWRLNEQTLWNVLLSLPVGAYLFGAGSREPGARKSKPCAQEASG